MCRKERLLINWVCWESVGHAIEAYKHGNSFRNGKNDLEIGVLLNAKSTIELADCLPQIDRVYPVDLTEFETSEGKREVFKTIPRGWDYIFARRKTSPTSGWEALDRFRAECDGWVRGKRVSYGYGWCHAEDFPEFRPSPLKLELPPQAKKFAKKFWSADKGVRISIVTGSSTGQKAPNVMFWRELIGNLVSELRNVEIVLIGALKKNGTRTLNISQKQVNGLVREFPQIRNGFDVGLLNQLAIAEMCDLHISPHTGMSFAIQCVGVPWLVLSGGEWFEYLLNGVPFICIYPDCTVYPCSGRMLKECRDLIEQKRPPSCMQEVSLEPKIPQIIRAARTLLNQELSYRQCLENHYQEMRLRVGESVGFFDGPAVFTKEYNFAISTSN